MRLASRTAKAGAAPQTAKPRPSLTLKQLEAINAKLAPLGCAIMLDDNDRPTLWRIERGAARVPGPDRAYDRYVRVNSRSKLPPAVRPLWAHLRNETTTE